MSKPAGNRDAPILDTQSRYILEILGIEGRESQSVPEGGSGDAQVDYRPRITAAYRPCLQL